MPCMCGDSCCPSCGPAQGNFKCPICNEWASEGCEHFDEETGELKPEFVAEAEAKAEAEREEERRMYEDWKAESELAEQYWKAYWRGRK